MADEDKNLEHQTAFRYGDDLLKRLDAWRKDQPGQPRRGTAIRMALDKFLPKLKKGVHE